MLVPLRQQFKALTILYHRSLLCRLDQCPLENGLTDCMVALSPGKNQGLVPESLGRRAAVPQTDLVKPDKLSLEFYCRGFPQAKILLNNCFKCCSNRTSGESFDPKLVSLPMMFFSHTI